MYEAGAGTAGLGGSHSDFTHSGVFREYSGSYI